MRRENDSPGSGKIGFVILMMVVIGLYACIPSKQAAPHSDIVSVTLKFQDSSGYTESTFRQEKLGKPLADFIAAARAAKKIEPARDSGLKDTGSISMLMDGCLCESPSDSLEIHLGGGKSEKYEYYCGGVSALDSGKPVALDLSERDKEMQANRWQAIRYRFCPRAYGCGDAEPPGWGYFIASPNAEEYSDEYEAYESLGMDWAHILDSSRVADPRVDMVFTYHARGGEIRNVVIDSLDGKYGDLGSRFRKQSIGMRLFHRVRDSLVSDSATVRITAYNAYYEK